MDWTMPELETIAARIVGYGPLVLLAWLAGAIAAGFLFALAVNWRSKSELQRVPYFTFVMALSVIGGTVAFTWLWKIPAAADERLWIIVLINLLAALGFGYYYGVLSAARARDAFNSNLSAIVALIPPLNLFLIFQPSREKESENRIHAIPVPRGGKGLLLGLALLVLYIALNVALDMQSRQTVETAQKNADAEKTIEFLIRSRGLEETLRLMAREGNKRLPIQVDEVTRLVTLAAEEKRFIRTYVVYVDAMEVTPALREAIERVICSHRPFRPLLREGAVFEEVYKQVDGTVIGKHSVSQATCDRRGG